MMKFSEWLKLKEVSATTRARAAAARGLLPLTGNLASHTGSTASPWETKQIEKILRKKSKKRKPVKNNQIDQFLAQSEELEKELADLDEIKKKNAKKKSDESSKNKTDKAIMDKKPDKEQDKKGLEDDDEDDDEKDD